MLSFKNLLSITLVALTISPSLASIAPIDVVSNLNKRVDHGIVTRSPSAAAVALAKRKAAVAFTRNQDATVTASPSAAEQQAASAIDPYAPNGVFLQSALAKSAARKRCGLDSTCQRSVIVPFGATAFCSAGICTFRCNSPQYGPSGIGCALQPTVCGSTPCPQVLNGFNNCSANGSQCVPSCQTSQGFSLVTNGSSFKCLNFNTDATNCGNVGITCPPSYNGMGSPVCRIGFCTLVCPVGQKVRTTISNGQRYCA